MLGEQGCAWGKVSRSCAGGRGPGCGCESVGAGSAALTPPGGWRPLPHPRAEGCCVRTFGPRSLRPRLHCVCRCPNRPCNSTGSSPRPRPRSTCPSMCPPSAAAGHRTYGSPCTTATSYLDATSDVLGDSTLRDTGTLLHAGITLTQPPTTTPSPTSTHHRRHRRHQGRLPGRAGPPPSCRHNDASPQQPHTGRHRLGAPRPAPRAPTAAGPADRRHTAGLRRKARRAVCVVPGTDPPKRRRREPAVRRMSRTTTLLSPPSPGRVGRLARGCP